MSSDKVFVPELQKAIASFISMLGEYTEKSLDFAGRGAAKAGELAGKGVEMASREIPIIIKQYLQLIFIENAVWISVLSLGAIAAIVFYVVIHRASKNWGEEGRIPARLFSFAASATIVCMLCIAMTTRVITCVQIYFAPKAFLVKHVIELTRQ